MSTTTHACNCIGPQRGQPLCPCMMHGITVRDGRYIQPERDLGPVPSRTPVAPTSGPGCVCPPGSEATCKGPLCPRQALKLTW